MVYDFLNFNRARGRGMGTTNRRLELPPASPTPSDETITPPASNHSDNPFLDELEIDEDAVFVECPMCQEMFPSDTVTLHAADCPGKSSSGVNQAVTFVQCPLCQDMFPDEIITRHASLCSLWHSLSLSCEWEWRWWGGGVLRASLPKNHSRLRGVIKVEAGYQHHTPKAFLYIIVDWIGVIKEKGGEAIYTISVHHSRMDRGEQGVGVLVVGGATSIIPLNHSRLD